MNEALAILASAVSVGGVIVAGFRFALRASIAEHVQPLSHQIVTLTGAIAGLREALAAQKVDAQTADHDLREILTQLREIVQDHETRIVVLEMPVQAPRRPSPPSRGKR